MSLHDIAKQVAAKGRNGDSVLVHMTPGEVAGLQRLAVANGESLTINPDTGMPEAFKLKSLLPMIAGALAAFIPGVNVALASTLAGGATGALTGDKNQSLLMRAGLGALGGWGGGGIGQALMGAGKSAATNVLTKAGEAAAKEAAGGVSEFVPTLVKVGKDATTALQTAQAAGVTSPAALQVLKGTAGSLMNPALGTSGSQLARLGLQNIAAAPSTVGGAALKGLGMPKMFAALSPLTVATPPTLKGSKEPIPEYQMYSYNPGTVNPNFGQPGEPYFLGQGYTAPRITNQNPYAPTYGAYDKRGKGIGTPGLSPLEQYMLDMQGQQQPPIAAAEGGSLSDYISKMNEAKATSDPPPASLSDYMANMNQARTSTSPMVTQQYRMPNMTPVGDFTVRGPASGYRGPFTNMMDYAPIRPFAEGGLASLGGYSDGGRLLKGPGDGVSDDIPATIHRDDGSKQEARLADGEFVFPARIVSEIGNGSTEAGAKKLYAVMDKIQKDRAKTMKDVAADTNAIRHMEALA